MRLVLSLFFTFCILYLIGQTITPLGNINPGAASSVFSEDNTAIYFNEKLYFAATNGTEGVELMVHDEAGTRLLKDINPGEESSEPRNFYIVNGVLIFNANDGTHGNEWWTTDGSTEGTQLIVDLYVGEDNGVWSGNSDPFTSFHAYNGELLFVGLDSKNNYELWKTDGSAEGTDLVRNIAPDNTSFNQPSFPEGFVDFQNEVFFACREGLWKTDGTTVGTAEVKSEHPTDVFGFSPGSLYATEDLIFMLETPGVWVSDGTEEGTVNIATLGQVNVNWSGNRFTEVGDVVLFPGSDEVHGNELWSSDGTEAGTSILVDLWEGPDGYAPQNTVLLNGKYIYKGNNGITGQELYMSDGTAAGTGLLKEIKTGSTGSFFLPTNIVADDNLVYFNAGKSFSKKKLWQSDGTAAGTVEVLELGDAETPFNFYTFQDKLFFFAKTDEAGWEPYIYDPAGVEVDADNDGFLSSDDCDDGNAAVNPDAEEIPFNDKDDDCNPETLDNDGDQDGFSVDDDCDDTDPAINPDAEEIDNNDVDENCDGELLNTSVLELNGVSINFYPNPVSEILYIDGNDSEALKVEIYDIHGRRVFQGEGLIQVNVADWTKGSYFIRVSDRTEVSKFAKFLVFSP